MIGIWGKRGIFDEPSLKAIYAEMKDATLLDKLQEQAMQRYNELRRQVCCYKNTELLFIYFKLLLFVIVIYLQKDSELGTQQMEQPAQDGTWSAYPQYLSSYSVSLLSLQARLIKNRYPYAQSQQFGMNSATGNVTDPFLKLLPLITGSSNCSLKKYLETK